MNKLDPFEDGAREFLLDEDIAAEQVAQGITTITGREVDGDGTPWSIVLEHLSRLGTAVRDLFDHFPDAKAYMADEWGWET